MRYVTIGSLALLCAVVLVACDTEEPPAAVSHEPTSPPVGEVTAEAAPKETATRKPTATARPIPETATPRPTATRKPTATARPIPETATPRPTATRKPTATARPIPTSAPSPTATSTSIPNPPTATPVPEPTTAPTADPVSVTEYDAASKPERDAMFDEGRILKCYEGLSLPVDSFCVDPSGASLDELLYLVAHLPDGAGLVLQGNRTMRAGQNVELGWLTYELQGDFRVITHLDP